jgi:hypothetical protein
MTETNYASALAQFIDLTKTDDKSHFEALGTFVIAYSNAEGIVHLLARKVSGLSDEKARILFGGMRLGDVVDRLRQFMHLDETDEETYAEVDACITQLGHIADVRHKLVHRGAAYFAGALVVSNFTTAKSAKNSETDIFDVFFLRDMTTDCGHIFLRLSYLVDPEKSDHNLVSRVKAQPWLYKHVPLRPPNQKRRGTPSTPQHAPDASRE